MSAKLEEINSREISCRKGWTRKSSFNAKEIRYLRPLPLKPYEPAIWSNELKVGVDYLVATG